MSKTLKYRGLASLALLRLSEADLRAMHLHISEMSPSSFVGLVRDIEYEIENSLSLTSDRSFESASYNSDAISLFNEIDSIRRNEIGMPVKPFAEMLMEALARTHPDMSKKISQFDSRRGLLSWIQKLVRIFPPQEIYHAAMVVSSNFRKDNSYDWNLK